MTAQFSWHEAYKAAVLETDWTKIRGRIQEAESAIRERQRLLSHDNGGTTDEKRQAPADARNGLEVLEARRAGISDVVSKSQPATVLIASARRLLLRAA